MSEAAIQASGLTKQFRQHGRATTAVDNLSLEVARGQTYGLIGPDGAGKTTTVRVILGLMTRTAGQSSILGFDSMRDTYLIRERVGYIAQQFVLPADLTVIENMRFFAGIQGMSQEAQRRRIPELLACSLIHSPQVVMLDEPTLGVDPVSRREFWNLLGNLRAEQGLTIFVCTPYMDEAERCTQVGLMYRGRLITSGTPAAIKALVGGRLLELTPSPFGPAEKLVSGLEGVLEVQTYGDKLHIFVDEVPRRSPQIEAALAGQGISHGGIREIEARMEEAFISLIRRQGNERNTAQ
jgi:ABC-2 type transport system ATP-binding protein